MFSLVWYCLLSTCVIYWSFQKTKAMKRLIFVSLFAIGISYTSFSQSTTTYRNEQGNVIGTATKDEYGTTYKNSHGNIIGTSTTQPSVYSQYQPIGAGSAQVLPRTDYSWMAAAAMRSRENISKASELFDVAQRLMEAEEYKEALHYFKAAEGYYSNSIAYSRKNYLNDFYLYLSLCYMKLNDKGQSLSYLDKLGPDIKQKADPVLGIAYIYYHFNEYKGSEKYLKKAISLDKYNPTAYNALINLYQNELPNPKKLRKIQAKQEKIEFYE